MKFEVTGRVVYTRPSWDPKIETGNRHGVVIEKSIREGSSNVQSLKDYEIYAILWDDTKTVERWYSEHDTSLQAESIEGNPFTAPANA